MQGGKLSNLVNETMWTLNSNNRDPLEVAWVGARDGTYAMSWGEFAEKFREVEYDAGYGGQEIASDLVVVLKGGDWLERHEYDGAEWWEYKTTPQLKTVPPKPFHRVHGGSWDTLAELEAEGELEDWD